MFIAQYKFSDFVADINNIPYRFDFGIIENNSLKYLIEFDGEQHFYAGNSLSSWNSIEEFNKTQERDKKKNNYCFAHNIPLIRIPYTIKNILKINDLKLETSKYIVKE